MSVLIPHTYRPRAGTDADALRAADKAVQAGFYYQQPGLLRRTTAVGADGEWLSLVIWRTVADANAADAASGADPSFQAFAALIEPGSSRAPRYADVGG